MAQGGGYSGFGGQHHATVTNSNAGVEQAAGGQHESGAATQGQSNGLNLGPVMNSFLTVNNGQIGQPQLGMRAFDRGRRESCGPTAMGNQPNISGLVPSNLTHLTSQAQQANASQ